jgi:FkbM family methyltransferase
MLTSFAQAMWKSDFRGKSRLVRALPIHGRRVFRLPWGEMELDLDDPGQRQMAFGGFERTEARIVRELVTPGMTVLDVGAHVGFYTLLMGDEVGPSGSVIAVEPFPENATNLRRNVGRNHLDQVTVLEVAASDRNVRSRLSVQPGRSGWGSLEIDREGGHVEVSLLRLDHYLRERHIRRVGFIKIDVEGHELQVLRGLGEYLQPMDGPILMVEKLVGRDEFWQDILVLLGSIDYEPVYLRGRAGQLRHNVFFRKPAHPPIA